MEPELKEAVHRRVAAILKAAMPPVRVRPELGDLVIDARARRPRVTEQIRDISQHKLDRSPTR
jgi:hypothetical protein